ncbi:MAG: substrate-binding domain-containing protein [Chloroflexota bacterium]
MESQSLLSNQIAETFRRRIITGDLAQGERLPSIRQAASDFNCAPGTVSRAYSQLADEGLVISHAGSGTVVSDDSSRERPSLQWATLVNQAERFLLQSLALGETPERAMEALRIASLRWEDIRESRPEQETPVSTQTGSIRFSGSHDMAINVLVKMLQDLPEPVRLDIEFAGSLGGLIALSQDRADIAGTHLWDKSSDSYNLPFVRRIMPGEQLALVTLFHRELGMMISPSCRLSFDSLEDLGQTGITFVNRQPGSGTRVWLDAQLRNKGIDTSAIGGYHSSFPTHLSVARVLAEGGGDVGLGTRSAADSYGLRFTTLVQERYELVCRESTFHQSEMTLLFELLDSTDFTRAAEHLSGCDFSQSGTVRWAL